MTVKPILVAGASGFVDYHPAWCMVPSGYRACSAEQRHSRPLAEQPRDFRLPAYPLTGPASARCRKFLMSIASGRVWASSLASFVETPRFRAAAP